jgi:hypothetical protein
VFFACLLLLLILPLLPFFFGNALYRDFFGLFLGPEPLTLFLRK